MRPNNHVLHIKHAIDDNVLRGPREPDPPKAPQGHVIYNLNLTSPELEGIPLRSMPSVATFASCESQSASHRRRSQITTGFWPTPAWAGWLDTSVARHFRQLLKRGIILGPT